MLLPYVTRSIDASTLKEEAYYFHSRLKMPVPAVVLPVAWAYTHSDRIVKSSLWLNNLT